MQDLKEIKLNDYLTAQIQKKANGATVHAVNNALTGYKGCYEILKNNFDINLFDSMKRARNILESFIISGDIKLIKKVTKENIQDGISH